MSELIETLDKTALSGFQVLGREARTTNASEMNGAGVIGRMWSEVTPGSSPIVAMYHDYESDKDGEYSYFLGAKPEDTASVPAGFVRRTVEAGDYLHLKFEGAMSPEVVVALWQKVWKLEQQGKIKRAYKTDFEVYDGPALDLYVGIVG